MINSLRPETDARAVIQPQPASLRLFHGNLQPLTAPQAFDPLIVQMPACISQHRGDPPITVTPILPSQLDHIPNKKIFIITGLRHIPLRGSMLLQHQAGPAFGDVELTPHQIDAGAAPCGAQKFPFAASANMSLSSVRSETALRSRSFSF